jgi:hypothetical protein
MRLAAPLVFSACECLSQGSRELNGWHMHANLAFAGGIHIERPPLFCREAERMLLQIKHEQAERKLHVYHLGPIQKHQVCCVSIS